MKYLKMIQKDKGNNNGLYAGIVSNVVSIISTFIAMINENKKEVSKYEQYKKDQKHITRDLYNKFSYIINNLYQKYYGRIIGSRELYCCVFLDNKFD